MAGVFACFQRPARAKRSIFLGNIEERYYRECVSFDKALSFHTLQTSAGKTTCSVAHWFLARFVHQCNHTANGACCARNAIGPRLGA